MPRRTLAALLVLALATGAAAAPDPTRPGKLAVGVTTVAATDASRDGRTVTVELWFPARRPGRDAEPLRRRFPPVLIVHGLCGSRLYYEYLATHLASHGFVVAAPDMQGATRTWCDTAAPAIVLPALAQDLSFVAHALRDARGPFGRWAKRIRGAATGLVGNSLGGILVVEAAKIDPSFTAVVGLAPAVGAGNAAPFADPSSRRAWMVMGATGDATVSFTALTQPFFDGLPAPAYLMRFTGGSHSGFSDENPDTEPDPRQAQHDATLRHATPFLLKYLAHRPRFARWLRASDDGSVALVARPK